MNDVKTVKTVKTKLGSLMVIDGDPEVALPLFELSSCPTIDLREMQRNWAKRRGYLVVEDERPEDGDEHGQV